MVATRGSSAANFEPNKGARTKTKHDKPSGDATQGDNNKAKKQGWNTMSHLVLKRFADDDPTLTAGARRDRVKHPHVAVAELDPSGRAVCKLCGDNIPKGTVRLCLWLECHKGYRNLCTLHNACFWQHEETKKLANVEEIAFHEQLSQTQIDEIRDQFKRFVESQNEEMATS